MGFSILGSILGIIGGAIALSVREKNNNEYRSELIQNWPDWSVSYVRKLKCQLCMEAAQLINYSEFCWVESYSFSSFSLHDRLDKCQKQQTTFKARLLLINLCEPVD